MMSRAQHSWWARDMTGLVKKKVLTSNQPISTRTIFKWSHLLIFTLPDGQQFHIKDQGTVGANVAAYLAVAVTQC